MKTQKPKARPHKAVLKAVEIVGSKAALARALPVKMPTLSQWISRDRPVPLERALQIEKLTGGKVTRMDLCANWRKFWPDAEQEAA